MQSSKTKWDTANVQYNCCLALYSHCTAMAGMWPAATRSSSRTGAKQGLLAHSAFIVHDNDASKCVCVRYNLY